jgi:hypothetical protein
LVPVLTGFEKFHCIYSCLNRVKWTVNVWTVCVWLCD